MTLLERRLLGKFQIRYGPNRVGPFGLLQPLADGVKLILKESFMPANVDVLVYWLAPALAMITALFVYAVLPFGPGLPLFGRPVGLRVGQYAVGLPVLVAPSSGEAHGPHLGGGCSRR